jgi:HSP20 family molecular chaperone IbpA
MKKFIFLILVLVFSEIHAQQNSQNIPTRQDEFYQMIEQMRARHREMIKSLMYDDVDYDSLFKQMEKSFDGKSFEDMFQGRINPIVGEFDWYAEGNFKVLKLKVTQVKDKPLDIKIENQTLKIKGVVESVENTENTKQKSVVQFERVFSLPDDVDATNPIFENKMGELHIKFPLKKPFNKQNSKPQLPESDRLPVEPSGTEQKI